MDTKKSFLARDHKIVITFSVFVVFGVIALFIGWFLPLIAYLALIFCITLLLLDRKLFSGIEAVMLAIPSLFCLIIVLYSLVTFFDQHLSIHAAPAVILAAMLCVLGWKNRKKKTLTITFSIAKRGDLGALLGILFTLYFLLAPVYHMSGASVAQFMSYGEDNASHYALTHYIYQHGDFAYEKNSAQTGLIDSLAIYPQGFHVNAAAFVGLIKPHHLSDEGFVKVYYLFVVLDYLLFAYWFIKLCISLASPLSRWVLLAILPAAVLLSNLGLFILLLDRGFQPQIFSYLGLSAIIFILTLPVRSHKTALRILFLSVLLTITIAASWWLLLPAVVFIVAFYGRRYHLWKPVFVAIKNNRILASLIAFAIIYPIFVGVVLNQKGQPLDEPGGVDKISWSIFWYLAPVVLITGTYLRKKLQLYSIVLISLLALIVLAMAIGLYQKITVGHYEYYFYKSIYSILIVAFSLFFIACMELLNLAYSYLKHFIWVLTTIVLIATAVIATATHMVYLRVYTYNYFPNAVQPTDLDILFSPKITHYKDVLFIGSCSNAENYLEDRWSGARLLSEGHQHSKIEIETLEGKDDQVIKHIDEDDKNPLLIVQTPSCLSKFSGYKQLDRRPNVTAIDAASSDSF